MTENRTECILYLETMFKCGIILTNSWANYGRYRGSYEGHQAVDSGWGGVKGTGLLTNTWFRFTTLLPSKNPLMGLMGG